MADYGLSGKVAIVTAGGGAICGEIARELAREGAHVAVWDIDRDAARRTVADIAAFGGRAIAVECDAADPGSVKAALDATLAEFSTVDKLRVKNVYLVNESFEKVISFFLTIMWMSLSLSSLHQNISRNRWRASGLHSI